MKKNLLKTAAFLALYIVFQALISFATLPPTIKEMKSLLRKSVDVVYFGDSVITFWPDNENDRESIVEKLQKLAGKDYSVGGIHHAAYNVDIFYSFIKYMKSSRRLPRIIVVPINMATFSPEWMRPHFQFDLERSILENNNLFYDVFYRPASIFSKGSISNIEYMNLDVYDGDKIEGKVSDYDNSSFSEYSEDKFAKKIVFRYMYKLDDKNPKVASVVKILEMCEKENVNLIFYITPVDYNACSFAVGRRFVENLGYNRSFLEKLITGKGAYFLDLSVSLTSEKFGWRQHSKYINEHMNSSGRAFVAAKIDREIRRILNAK